MGWVGAGRGLKQSHDRLIRTVEGSNSDLVARHVER